MTEELNQNYINREEPPAPEIFDEDFGRMKMEMFKEKCRDILNPIKEEGEQLAPAIIDQDEYIPSAMDES